MDDENDESTEKNVTDTGRKESEFWWKNIFDSCIEFDAKRTRIDNFDILLNWIGQHVCWFLEWNELDSNVYSPASSLRSADKNSPTVTRVLLTLSAKLR